MVKMGKAKRVKVEVDEGAKVTEGEDAMSEAGTEVSLLNPPRGAPRPSGKVPIAQLRERIAHVLAQRQQLPAPCPTDKFPLPRAGQCELCARCWQTTPNPLKGRPCPFLEVSRAGSNICIPCRNSLNWAYKGVKEAQMIQRCKDPVERERFNFITYVWEDRYNDPTTACVKTVQELPDDCLTKVMSQQTASMESKLMVGILWPLPSFSDAVTRALNRKPTAADMTTIIHNGEKVKGVIRDPKHGNPPGTYEVTSKSSLSHVMTVVQEDSDRAVRGSQQCKDTFAALLKRVGVAASLRDNEEGSSADVVNIKCKHKQQAGDILDDLWTNPFQQEKVKAAPDPNRPKPQPKTHKAKDPEARRQIEYNESEQVLFKGKQTLNLVQSKIDSVTIQSLAKLLKDVKGRQTDALMELYRKDMIAGDQQQTEFRTGAEILHDLNDMETKVSAWLAVKTGLRSLAKKVEDFKGGISSLMDVLSEALAGPFNQSGRMLVAMKIWERALELASKEEPATFATFAYGFLPGRGGDDGGIGKAVVDYVDDDAKHEVVTSATMNYLTMMMSMKNNVEKVTESIKLFREPAVSIAGGDASINGKMISWKDDINMFYDIVCVRDPMTNVDQTEKNLHDIMEGVTASRFQKALKLLPTGVLLRAEVSAVAAAIRHDDQFKDKLSSLTNALVHATPLSERIAMEATEVDDNGPPLFPDEFLGVIHGGVVDYADLLQSTSDHFKKAHQTQLTAIRDAFVEALTFSRDSAHAKIGKVFAQMVTVLCKTLSNVDDVERGSDPALDSLLEKLMLASSVKHVSFLTQFEDGEAGAVNVISDISGIAQTVRDGLKLLLAPASELSFDPPPVRRLIHMVHAMVDALDADFPYDTKEYGFGLKFLVDHHKQRLENLATYTRRFLVDAVQAVVRDACGYCQSELTILQKFANADQAGRESIFSTLWAACGQRHKDWHTETVLAEWMDNCNSFMDRTDPLFEFHKTLVRFGAKFDDAVAPCGTVYYVVGMGLIGPALVASVAELNSECFTEQELPDTPMSPIDMQRATRAVGLPKDAIDLNFEALRRQALKLTDAQHNLSIADDRVAIMRGCESESAVPQLVVACERARAAFEQRCRRHQEDLIGAIAEGRKLFSDLLDLLSAEGIEATFESQSATLSLDGVKQL
ncbi:unnamed protein product, partial [Prorocentrum cordatum]